MTTKEMIAVMQAFVEGKKIQSRSNYRTSEEWCDRDTPFWNWEVLDYRIKPEEPKPKLRPYKNAKEFRRAQKTHGIYIQFKFDALKIIHTPLAISDGYIFLLDINSKPIKYTYNYILENCKFEDDTPCGIIEEEQQC